MANTTAIILAAGKSTRMKSGRAKPLHEVCGQPMLWYVLQACYEAGCQKVMVVVGHGKDQIIPHFADDSRIIWVEQAQQLGSGHAVRMCQKQLRKFDGNVFVLAGDAPLIRGEVLQSLLQVHQEERAAASTATAILDNPAGCGRILRDRRGEFLQIIEDAQATNEQQAIREVFTGCYCFKSQELRKALPKLTTNNPRREYDLAEVFAMLKAQGKTITAVQALAAEDALSVNTRQQLAEIDLIMQERIHRQLRDDGVTIVNSFNTYIEAGVTIGKDSVIQPFTFIGRDSSIGAQCVIGPFARIQRQSILPQGLTVLGHPTQEGGLKI